MPGTEGWYVPVSVVTEAMPEYVEQTSQDAAMAQALQAEYDAALCHPQAAATAGSDPVENPNSSQAQSLPLFELDFRPAPTRSNKHNRPLAQSSAHGTFCATPTAYAQEHSSNPFAVLDSDVISPPAAPTPPATHPVPQAALTMLLLLTRTKTCSPPSHQLVLQLPPSHQLVLQLPPNSHSHPQPSAQTRPCW